MVFIFFNAPSAIQRLILRPPKRKKHMSFLRLFYFEEICRFAQYKRLSFQLGETVFNLCSELCKFLETLWSLWLISSCWWIRFLYLLYVWNMRMKSLICKNPVEQLGKRTVKDKLEQLVLGHNLWHPLGHMGQVH